MEDESIEQRAARAEALLSSLNIICVAQEWDKRIDCFIKLADGSLAGEMIPLVELTDARVLETGKRLRKRAEGSSDPLVNEIRPPTRIIREKREQGEK